MRDFDSICPTAIITAYPKIYTNIKYSKEIYSYLSQNVSLDNITLNKMLAPEIEARYKLIDKLFEQNNIEQVIELAAGYSSRGLEYANRGIKYIEIDLKQVIDIKKKIILDINKEVSNLEFIEADVTNSMLSDIVLKKIDKTKPVAIISEGLFRYLTWNEKEKVVKNIFNILSVTNGCWITCDITPKGLKETQNIINTNLNYELNNVTDRNKLNDRFENIEHINKFMKEKGFSKVEIHKFMEVKDDIVSFNNLNIDRDSYEQLFNRAVVGVIKI